MLTRWVAVCFANSVDDESETATALRKRVGSL